MAEWIRVEDRLPELNEENESENVLVFCDDGFFVAGLIFYPVSENRKKPLLTWSEHSTGCGCCAGDIFPTHWMPLPKEPENG